jgi:hypothetical protein
MMGDTIFMATNVTVSPNIVRAWFDTVLNPLIRGLGTEAAVLAERKLTWRDHPPRLASIVTVREHIVSEAWPNLDQFLLLHPEVTQPIAEHDRGVQRLFDACRDLEAALIASKPLQEVLDRALSKAPPDRDAQSYFGALNPCDYLKVLSVYIINDVEQLPAYNLTAPLWNDRRDEFIAIRETAGVRPLWGAALTSAKALAVRVNTLSDTLKTLRNDLSLSNGVPIVERLSIAV